MPWSLSSLFAFARECAHLHFALLAWSSRDGPDALRPLVQQYLDLLLKWGHADPPKAGAAFLPPAMGQFKVSGATLSAAELFAKGWKTVGKLLLEDIPRLVRRAVLGVLNVQAIALCQASKSSLWKSVRCIGLFNVCLQFLGMLCPGRCLVHFISIEQCLRSIAAVRVKQQARPTHPGPYDRKHVLQSYPSEVAAATTIAEAVISALYPNPGGITDPNAATSSTLANGAAGSVPAASPSPSSSSSSSSVNPQTCFPLCTSTSPIRNTQDLLIHLKDTCPSSLQDFYLDCWLAEFYANLKPTACLSKTTQRMETHRYISLALHPPVALWAEEGTTGESEIQAELLLCKAELARETFAVPESANADGRVMSKAYGHAYKCVQQLSVSPEKSRVCLENHLLGIIANAGHILVERFPIAFSGHLPFLIFLTDLYRVIISLGGHAPHLLRQHLAQPPDPVLPLSHGDPDPMHGYLPSAALLSTRLCLLFAVGYDKLLQEVDQEVLSITDEYQLLLSATHQTQRSSNRGKSRKKSTKGKGKKAPTSLKQPDGTSDCLQALIDRILCPKVCLGSQMGSEAVWVLTPVVAHAITTAVNQLCEHSLHSVGILTPIRPLTDDTARPTGGNAVSRQLSLDIEKLKNYLSSVSLQNTAAFSDLHIWKQVAACIATIIATVPEANRSQSPVTTSGMK